MRFYKVTHGPHYDTNAAMVVPELSRNSFYILFHAKGIVNYRQIISSHLYVRINQFWPSKERVHLQVEYF